MRFLSQRSLKPGFLFLTLLLAVVLIASTATAQDDSADGKEPATQDKNFITAGGYVGYIIILLSFVGVGLAVHGFLSLTEPKLMPPLIMAEAQAKAQGGKFSEVLTLCQGSDSLLARILVGGLSQAGLGLPAVHSAMQDQGAREVTRLHHRVGYIGFVGTVAPMLGLLGTVIGMIQSFNVLGHAGGTAQPDKLALGISTALVTTCMGLIVAIPLMFLHSFLRNRVTRLGQEAGGFCEQFVRTMAVVVERNQLQAAKNGAAAAKKDESDTNGKP